jgi:hypothetical protein
VASTTSLASTVGTSSTGGCAPLYASCVSSPCCQGACSVNAHYTCIVDCGQLGQPCSATRECCDGTVCAGGHCEVVASVSSTVSIAVSSSTTGGCSVGGCAAMGCPCTGSADCCAGLPCVIPNGSTVGTCGCKPYGAPCMSSSECCSNQCAGGLCGFLAVM